MKKKITVVGAGLVGSTCALKLMEADLGDIVLLDIVDNLPQGKALDIMQSAPLENYGSQLMGSNAYEDTKESDLVVITAGLSRKPGMSRDDLLNFNAKVIKDVTIKICKHSSNPIIIVVTNPLDVMTHLVQKVSGLPVHQVLGMAGVLDSTRYSYFIAEHLNVMPSQVHSMVLGGHGDSMLPLPRFSTVNGIPITEFLNQKEIEKINQRTKQGGAEIVSLLKNASAYHAPAASVVQMCHSLFSKKRRILPCSVYLSGAYGIHNIYCGVPVFLGSKGVEDIVEIHLDSSELALLQQSAQAVKKTVDKLSVL